MSKTWKRDIFDTVSSYESLDDLEALIKRARAAEAAGEWKNIKTELADDGYGHLSMEFVGERVEANSERVQREKLEIEQAKRMEKYQREQYEALKAKFEKKE